MAKKAPAKRDGEPTREPPNEQGLRPQQVQFCHYVAAGVSPHEAYRRCYQTTEASTGYHWGNAHRVLKLPQVAAYLAALREESRAAAAITREEKLRHLETQIRDPDLPPKDRQAAIKIHNEMTGDNAAIQVELIGAEELTTTAKKFKAWSSQS